MKVLYIGDFIKGNGPSTVDLTLKEIFDVGDDSLTLCYGQSGGWKSLIKSFLLFLNVDLLHVSGVSICGLLLIVLSKLLGRPCSMTMHGALSMEKSSRNIPKYRLLMERFQISMCDEIYPVSKLLARKAYIKNAHVIPNGFNPITSNFNLEKVTNIVTLIGGSRKEKRNLLACQVIKKLNEEKKLGIKVNLFGESGSDLQEIKGFDFLDDFGFTSKNNVYKSLAQSKLFIQYSSFESFSLAICEAYNFDCKIIASENVGVNEFFRESTSYKIAMNEEELSNAIESAITDGSPFQIEHNLYKWNEIADMYKNAWMKLVQNK